jgi:hypothetical protein
VERATRAILLYMSNPIHWRVALVVVVLGAGIVLTVLFPARQGDIALAWALFWITASVATMRKRRKGPFR